MKVRCGSVDHSVCWPDGMEFIDGNRAGGTDEAAKPIFIRIKSAYLQVELLPMSWWINHRAD